MTRLASFRKLGIVVDEVEGCVGPLLTNVPTTLHVDMPRRLFGGFYDVQDARAAAIEAAQLAELLTRWADQQEAPHQGPPAAAMGAWTDDDWDQEWIRVVAATREGGE